MTIRMLQVQSYNGGNEDSSLETSVDMDPPVLSEPVRRSGGPQSVTSKAIFHDDDDEYEDEDVNDAFQPTAFCCLPKEKWPRVWFINFMCWPWFERISILVILTNCVTLGMYDPFDKHCETKSCKILEVMETCIFAFFLVEMLVKWVAMGLFGKQGYFADSWNKLDCFIVAAGTFELAYGEGEYLSAVRSIRVLRPLRAINRVPSIRILVMLLLDTLPMLGNVLAICFFIFAIFGIIGVQLWQGVLRNRCFPDELNHTTIMKHNLSTFYRPSFDDRDYLCSLPGDAGLSHCNQRYFTNYTLNGVECNGTFPRDANSTCINWNQYYTTCRRSNENIYYGSISFDNIVIATVAIFQIITLEGWTDIMYKMQDGHSFWDWWYFVVLILLGSYFMTNLCLVVITSQFQETKQRETELLKQSRLRSRASISTESSGFMQQGCYTQILHYLEHLGRQFKRRVLKLEKNAKKQKVNPCLQLRGRRDNVKSVHHHHHHYHYYHHFVHHPSCQCSNVDQSASESPPGSAVGGQFEGNEGRKVDAEGNRMLVVPQIQVIAQAATAVYKDPDSSADMVSTATANINVGALGSTASILAYSKTADSSVSMATQATAHTINAACSCAAEMREGKRVWQGKMEDSPCSSEDQEGSKDGEKRGKKLGCFTKFKKMMKSCVQTNAFNRFIMTSIFLNTFCMAVEHHGQPAKMTEAFTILNIIFTLIFALEMLAKIIAFGPYGYIKDAFNLFDGVIVIVSVMDVFAADTDSGISVLRSFRLLRIFKLVRFMPALQRQLRVMVKTLDNVVTFLGLLLLFIFTASILGMHLFGAQYSFPNEQGEIVAARANFDSLFWALVTVFQILTQEDWNVVLYDGMRSTSPWAALYFLFLMIIGNYILFNLLVAILVEGFADHSESETMLLESEKERSPVEQLSPKEAPEKIVTLKEQTNQNIAFSWPNIHEKVLREQAGYKPVARCSSVPGVHEVKSGKQSRSMSYLHVLAIDALDGRLRRGDEDTYLVPAIGHLPTTTQTSSPIQHTSWRQRRKSWSLYLFSPDNRFRKLIVKLHRNVWFDRVVLFFILLNCVVMAIEEPGMDPQSKTAKFIDIMQYIFTAIFTIEMCIKVISLGLIIGHHTYLKSGWNVVDGILVIFSLIDLVVSLATHSDNSFLGVLRVFRAFRTLRPLRVINRAPELKVVVETLLSSLKPIGNVVLIAATFFTIFGILGVQLFKGKFYSCDVSNSIEIRNKSECLLNKGTWLNNEYNFDHLIRALLTLFVFATRDGWVSIMYSGVDVVGVDQQPIRNNAKWNVLYFVAFLLLAGFVVLNMLVGVVVENFHKCRDKFLQEQSVKDLRETPSNSRDSNAIDVVDLESYSLARRRIYTLVTYQYFDLVIAIVICVNVLFMGMEHYEQPEDLTLFLKYANYVFTVLFIVEAILKIVALGAKNYFSSRWNCMDMIIVVLSIGGIILDELASSHLPMNPTIIRVMRVLRITRVLKLLKTAEGIRSLLDTVGKALPQVANLGLLFILLFFIFGALGMELFGDISCDEVGCEGLDSHAHFNNFGYAVLTLFRVATGDNWNGIMKDTINSKRCNSDGIDACKIIQNIAPIYFATFVLITQFVLLNVVVAVMMKHLEEAKIIEGEFVSNRDQLSSLRGSEPVSIKQIPDPDLGVSEKPVNPAGLLPGRPVKSGIEPVKTDIESSPNGETTNSNPEKSGILVSGKRLPTGFGTDSDSIDSKSLGDDFFKKEGKVLDSVNGNRTSMIEEISEANSDEFPSNTSTVVRPSKRSVGKSSGSELQQGEFQTSEDIKEPLDVQQNRGWFRDSEDHMRNNKQGGYELQLKEPRGKRSRRKKRKVPKDQGHRPSEVQDELNEVHGPKEVYGPKDVYGPKVVHGGPKEFYGKKDVYRPKVPLLAIAHVLNGTDGPEIAPGLNGPNVDHDAVVDLVERQDMMGNGSREDVPTDGHGPKNVHGPEDVPLSDKVSDLNDGPKMVCGDERGPKGSDGPKTVHGLKEDLETEVQPFETEQKPAERSSQSEKEEEDNNNKLTQSGKRSKKDKQKSGQQKEWGADEGGFEGKSDILPPKLHVLKVLPRVREDGGGQGGRGETVGGACSSDQDEVEASDTQQPRVHYHGMRLEPLPSNVTKLSLTNTDIG